MKEIKTKAIKGIEEKIVAHSEDEIRCKVLESAKSFKTSWVELGQTLYSVWKDKMYKEWGFIEFDAYVRKEIGIKKQTALKLLRSYSFLEKEEPRYIKREHSQEVDVATVPTYEAVDVLRQASKNKNLEASEYEKIKDEVLNKGKEARDVKKSITSIIKNRQELDPEEAWQKKKESLVKRLLTMLKTIKKELRGAKVLSAKVLEDTENLIERIEKEIS